MPREEKQLPSPPPEGMNPKHENGLSNGGMVKRLASGSSLTSNGQGKRNTYGSGTGATNGLKEVDPNDDLFIRLLAQKALPESQHNQILNPEEVDDLKNVRSNHILAYCRNNRC
jgi:hypothetical protein